MPSDLVKALILGGVKSGKSRYAERLAMGLSSRVCLIATARAGDEEMAARIARHRAERPANWQTLEAPVNLAAAIKESQEADVVIVDCLTLWLTNLLTGGDERQLSEEILALEQVLAQVKNNIILVSNETNMGIVPLGELSRQYCDQAGLLHQRLAQICNRVELIVAGLPLTLKSGGEGS